MVAPALAISCFDRKEVVRIIPLFVGWVLSFRKLLVSAYAYLAQIAGLWREVDLCGGQGFLFRLFS